MTKADRHEALHKLMPVALIQAQERPWDDVSLWDICTGAGIGLADCARLGITKEAVLDKLHVHVDIKMLENAEAPDRTQTARDLLFDVLMARFDVLEENRAAWQSIVSSGKRDPSMGLARRARWARTGAWALEAAGVSASGVAGAARAIGITRILRQCEAVWLNDVPDMAKTMARLDQELRKGEQFIEQVSAIGRFMASYGKHDNRHNVADGVPD
jgi:ubiquinone biosynthesis protein COQ9